MKTFVALMRGINVGKTRSLPMAELRVLCGDLGFEKPETYIQSGNLLIDANGSAEAVATALESAIAKRFGFSIPVIVRDSAHWKAYRDGDPFANDANSLPNHVHLCLSRAKPAADAVEKLRERAADGERIERAGDAIWIDFTNGAGRSKLSPVLIDRLVGSPVTARNHNTVLMLQAMIEARGPCVRP